MDTITLGGGCFWCLEAIFSKLKGVVQAESGYCGGTVDTPTYQQVCTGTTGHAEVVQVVFDSAVISLRDLLTVFFALHDPTTRNRQGGDVGTQYRSAIFYHTDEQQRISHEVISETDAAGIWNSPIVTEVTRLPVFYLAEAYHQRYYALNENQGYCRMVIAPKIAKLEKLFSDKVSK